MSHWQLGLLKIHILEVPTPVGQYLKMLVVEPEGVKFDKEREGLQ